MSLRGTIRSQEKESDEAISVYSYHLNLYSLIILTEIASSSSAMPRLLVMTSIGLTKSTKSVIIYKFCSPSGEALAGVAELVDAPGLGPGRSNPVQVQVLSPAPHTTLGGDLKSQISKFWSPDCVTVDRDRRDFGGIFLLFV